MKRFTETTKWTVNPWFRKLPARLKCLWMFFLDNCDAAGVIEPDWELISFQIGEPVSAGDLAHFDGRVQTLPNGKLWVTKFIHFQFGDISPACKAHTPVFKSIDLNGLPYRFIGAPGTPALFHEDAETVACPSAAEAPPAEDATGGGVESVSGESSVSSPSTSVSKHTPAKGYPKGILRDQEEEKEKDKDKDKDKDKEKENRSLGSGSSGLTPGETNAEPPPGAPRGSMAQATEIVALYPRREAIREAVEHVARAIREGSSPQSIADGTRAIAAAITQLPSAHLNAYVPSAAKFFANRRWEDDPRTWLRAATKGNRHTAGAMPAPPSLGGRKGVTIRVG